VGMNKMKNKKYQTNGTKQRQNGPQTHDCLLSLLKLSTGTSIKSGRVKLVIRAQTYPIIEMMQV